MWSQGQREEGVVGERRGWRRRKLSRALSLSAVLIIASLKRGITKYCWQTSAFISAIPVIAPCLAKGYVCVLLRLRYKTVYCTVHLCVSGWGKGAFWTCSKASAPPPPFFFCTALISIATTSQERASRMYAQAHTCRLIRGTTEFI